MCKYSCMNRIDINLWFVLLTTIDFAISEKFVNFRFAKIFNSWCSSYGDDEIWAQNPLIPKWKPNRFDHKGLYGQNFYVSMKESKGSELKSTLTWFMYVLHFALLCLVEFLSYKQRSGVITWSYQNSQHWCIFTRQHLVLLLS